MTGLGQARCLLVPCRAAAGHRVAVTASDVCSWSPAVRCSPEPGTAGPCWPEEHALWSSFQDVLPELSRFRHRGPRGEPPCLLGGHQDT